jgi:transcriptional regulator with XRE-family HTH domain
MSDLERTLTDFMRAWEAGRTPDPDDYLERVPPADRPELSERIRTYLMVAPEPDYDDAAWERLAAAPAAVRALQMPLGDPEPWPSLLPRLRARAGLSWREVAQRLGVQRPDKAAGYLEAMERGEHDPRRVTRRALDGLGRILGVPADALAWTGPGGATTAGAVLRSSAPASADIDMLLTLADLATLSADDWDDSDDLFMAGRDA